MPEDEDVVYLVVAVRGTNGQPTAVNAVESLSNEFHKYRVAEAQTYAAEDLEDAMGDPILYFP